MRFAIRWQEFAEPLRCCARTRWTVRFSALSWTEILERVDRLNTAVQDLLEYAKPMSPHKTTASTQRRSR